MIFAFTLIFLLQPLIYDPSKLTQILILRKYFIMRGMLVFDHLNDILYVNCCSEFVQHVAKLAKTQGLVASKYSTMFGKGKKLIDPNILIQLFSPLVTSQRFMAESFGNPYTSVQCEDGTNIVFQDYMGFLFLRIGSEDIPFLRRAVGICITLVSYLCGPDVALLKASPGHAEELDSLLKTWTALQSCDQSFLVEALEQMTITPQRSTSLIKSLQQIASKVQIHNEHVHALLIHDTKLLSWYSSKGCHEMSPQDILFLMIICQKLWPGENLRSLYKKRISYSKVDESNKKKNASSSSETESDDYDWTSAGCLSSRENLFEDSDDFEDLGEESKGSSSPKTREVKHYVILLKNNSQFVPHRVHIGMVQEGLYLVILVEPPTTQLISSLCTSIQMSVDFGGARRDVTRDKQYFDVMDSSMKKIFDLLKKQKNMTFRNELSSRWDCFKIGFNSYIKSKDPISVQVNPVIDALIAVFRAYFNDHIIFDNPKILQPLANVFKKVKADTDEFWGFLKIQTSQNLSLGARETLSISKYLEDFPGLVHFIYVDRSRHSITMPALDYIGDDTVILTRRKIWSMIKFAREHMQQGHFSLMWKDTAFNFAYFLWFEDLAGNSIRPKIPPSLPLDGHPSLPGILCGDFYKRLIHECFPGSTTPKVRCLELFCIHLGLITSSCVLEHSKRLASTIYEVTGINNPMDIL